MAWSPSSWSARGATALAALGALVATPPATAAPRALLSAKPGTTCERLDVEADSSDCGREACHVLGHVVLVCGDLKLWADEAIIALGPDQSFAGAEARGNVVLVERETLLTCQRMTLGPDRIQGKIDGATIRIKRDPTAKDALGRPAGRNEFTFAGNLERDRADHWVIDDASFTVCDCGDDPPSWQIEAREIDATINERATLYRPQLHINPFSLGLVPITPPLLPLSVPFKKRAPGFLAPQLRFYGAVFEPTVDLPFFVPLGNSWDVTLSPGLRTDWGSHKLTPPSAWGAFRLGGRLRYAPHEAIAGEASVQWTGDRKHRAAKLYRETIADQPWLEPEAALRERLTNRVSIDWTQRVDLGSRLRWLVDTEWLSDDLIQQDFKVSIAERFADYLPSRTVLLWRQPYLVGLVAADYLQRLEGFGASDYSNTAGHDRAVGQRGPALRLSLPGASLGAGVTVDADLTWTRYGAWNPDDPPTLNLGGATAALSYRDRLGPLRATGRAAFHALWLTPAARESFTAAAATSDVDLDLPLARGFGTFIHLVAPRLSYRGLPYRSAATDAVAAVDERLGWRTLHQGMASLEQRLYVRRDAAVDEIASLTVSQPWDLTSGDALQTRLSLSWNMPPLFGGSLWSSVEPARLMRMQELGASIWLAAGPVRVGSLLVYLTPGADRLHRSIYELAASRTDRRAGQWVHSASPFASVSLGSRASVSWSSDLLLPVEDDPVDRRIGFLEHRVSLGYHSPCECWDIGVLVAVPAVDPLHNLRAQVTVSIAGYALGTQ